MATALLNLSDDVEDLAGEIRKRNLPVEVALATYLKNNYGDHMKGMKDKDWVADAAEVVEGLGLKTEGW